MRVVLDAVVFVRAVINPRSIWGRVLSRADEYTIVISQAIVLEILGVLQRPELRDRLFRLSGLPELQVVLAHLAQAEGVEPPAVPAVCRDPKDDKYFACALAGGADYIVSEDGDILAVAEYEGIQTIRAVAFLHLLDDSAWSSYCPR